ncbi:MAG: AIR synthase-related protein, partial [Pseudomonadota bacterium]
GDVLILIGETKGHLGASLYAREILGLEGDDLGPPPPVDLETEKRNADFVRSLIEQGLVNAVHDVSDGGIACAAAEMALASGVGIKLAAGLGFTDTDGLERGGIPDVFSEDSSCYLIATSNLDLIDQAPNRTSLSSGSIDHIGWIGGSDICLACIEEDHKGQSSVSLSRLREAHEGWLPSYMNKVE